MERRDLVGGGLVAGLTALVSADAEAATAGEQSDEARVANAVGELRRSLEQQYQAAYQNPWTGIAAIRRQQREWLRSTQKFPDFLEVGIGVWESVYDWHVRHQQPLNMTRQPDGRYMIIFMFTALILRSDQAADYVGYPFDTEQQRRDR
jgi:hypothetical protein